MLNDFKLLKKQILKVSIVSLIILTNLLIPYNVVAQCWSSISAGEFHNLAIKEDGSLWAWGGGGRLGDGEFTDKITPVRIGLKSDTSWDKISAGSSHSLAIKSDGSLWSWGYNYTGQLGNGTTAPSVNSGIVLTPQKITNDNDWIRISAGGGHSLAIKSDGSLWAWGSNSSGQLGDSSFSDKNTPVKIGSDNDWKKISAGVSHSLAIKSDGSLWAWGSNSHGEIVGPGQHRNSPTKINLGNDWDKISAGSYYSAAIKNDKTPWVWGRHNGNVLGNGITKDVHVPELAGRECVEISAGYNHTLKINSSGILSACGKNYNGQLGNGTTEDLKYPTQINSDRNWTKISNGQQHSIALKNDGTLWAWGSNLHGQLGIGKQKDFGPNPTPRQVKCTILNTSKLNISDLFKVYPNPTLSHINLEASNNITGSPYYIFNSFGKLVKTGLIDLEQTKIDVSNLNLGSYYLRIGDDLTQNFKFIKVH